MMSLDTNAIQLLTNCDLTILEARIYLALCKHGSLKTKDISKLTKTSRPDVYRVLGKLQDKGLIEKIIEKPARFNAVPLEKGINFLLHRKETDHKTLLAQAEQLLCVFKEKDRGVKQLTPAPSQFIMIPQREMVVRRIKDAIDKSKESVDIFLSWRRLVAGMTSVFLDNSERAWKRGVRFRIVAENPKENANKKLAMQFSKISPFCSIRFLPGHPKTVMGIYDRNEAFIVVNPREGLYDSPALWSNNLSLITAIQEYFDLLWLTSKKNPN